MPVEAAPSPQEPHARAGRPGRDLRRFVALGAAGGLVGAVLNAASAHGIDPRTPVYPAAAVVACGDPGTTARVMPLSEALSACAACSAGFVDARGAAAFGHGHIPGAVHLPPEGGPDWDAALEALRRFDTVVVYGDTANCGLDDGVVSRLRAAGFADVRTLDASWEQWFAAGGPAQSGSCEQCGGAP